MQDPRDGPNWLPFPLPDRSRPATVPPWVQLSRPGTGVDDQLVAAHWDHPPVVRSSRRSPCHRPVVEPTNWSQLSHRPFRPVPYHPHPQFSTKSTVPTGPTGPEAQTFSPPPVGKLINWSRCGRFDGRSWSSPPFFRPVLSGFAINSWTNWSQTARRPSKSKNFFLARPTAAPAGGGGGAGLRRVREVPRSGPAGQ